MQQIPKPPNSGLLFLMDLPAAHDPMAYDNTQLQLIMVGQHT